MTDKNNSNNSNLEIGASKPTFFDVYNKSYRLVAAVFVVVKLMDDNNDLRQRIEKNALNIMSLCVQFKDNTVSNSHKIYSSLERDILELISYIDIAALSGFISEMNGAILKKEFESFLTQLSNFTSLSQTDKAESIQTILNKEDDLSVSDVVTNANLKTLSERAASTSVSNNSTIEKVDSAKRQKRKDTRKTLIFDYIQKNGESSIRDIVPNIRGCSEKTVQRELLDLVKEGKLKKTGERRWSRYSVI